MGDFVALHGCAILVVEANRRGAGEGNIGNVEAVWIGGGARGWGSLGGYEKALYRAGWLYWWWLYWWL